MRLLVVSNVIHYRHEGRLYANGAYAREIDVWADLFPRVVIAAPCREAPPSGSALPFTRPNVSIAPQIEAGGQTPWAKLALLAALPLLVWGLCREMRKADAIHVRCPGSFGLLGTLLAPLFSRRLVAKYAGQWNGYPGEPASVRLQRAVLGGRWWRGPVTVYGRWEGQAPHVVPFFTSVLAREQLARAAACAARRCFTPPLRALFVGRLSRAKNVDALLRAIARLEGVEGVVVGDGPERGRLRQLAAALKIEDRVRFTGGLPFERVLDEYEQAHVLVLASETEGWPKALVEAMAFGMVAAGPDRGLVPWIVAGGRGFVVPPGDVDALAALLAGLAANPERMAEIGARAAAWAGEYSLDGLREALRGLIEEHWAS